MTNRRHCVECDELVQDPSVPEEHKASCSHSRERLDSYARGRADERAAIVRWLRGCMRPDFARAAGIDNGDHIAWAQRSAAADTRGRGE